MPKSSSKIALIAIVPAAMIPIAHLLTTMGVGDAAVGFVQGIVIGLMIVALVFYIRSRGGERKACLPNRSELS